MCIARCADMTRSALRMSGVRTRGGQKWRTVLMLKCLKWEIFVELHHIVSPLLQHHVKVLVLRMTL